jgi:hypothetical protein
VRMIKKQEDKFEVDPDWVLPTVTDLLPDGGRLDQEVRRLERTYFDTPSAVGGLIKSMRTSRYAHLVQLLRGWRAAPPLTEAAGEEAKAAVKCGEGQANSVQTTTEGRRRHRTVASSTQGDEAARYTAEFVEPADSQMKAVAREAEKLQALLGKHQDAIVAANFLATISSDGDGTEGTEFTYGILWRTS